MKHLHSQHFFNINQKKKIIFLVVVAVVLLVAVSPLRHIFNLAYNVYVDDNIQLVNVNNDINILLLGTAGKDHDGGDLTDTIILAHINREKNIVYLFSIPRDLWITDKKIKINSLYALEKQAKRDGFTAIKQAVEQVTGLPVHYAINVDFDGFIALVDALGGIDVSVEHGFVDHEYPVKGMEDDLCGRDESELELLSTMSSQLEAFPCRYKTVDFAKGVQHMTGQQALEFVRSRHAEGSEGTDFARSHRQQQVLKAVKDKTLSLGIIVNPAKVFGIYGIIKDNIKTTIKTEEFDDFIKLAQSLEGAQIQSLVIDYGDDQQERYGLLLNPPISDEYNYRWVLIPRTGNGDFSEIQKYVQCVIAGNECQVSENSINITPPALPQD